MKTSLTSKWLNRSSRLKGPSKRARGSLRHVNLVWEELGGKASYSPIKLELGEQVTTIRPKVFQVWTRQCKCLFWLMRPIDTLIIHPSSMVLKGLIWHSMLRQMIQQPGLILNDPMRRVLRWGLLCITRLSSKENHLDRMVVVKQEWRH